MKNFLLLTICSSVLIGCNSLSSNHYLQPKVPEAIIYQEKHRFNIDINKTKVQLGKENLNRILKLYDLRSIEVHLNYREKNKSYAENLKEVVLDYGIEPSSIFLRRLSNDKASDDTLEVLIIHWKVKNQQCIPDGMMKHSFNRGCYVELNRFKQLVSPSSLLRVN